jgi:hypothetical protein
LHVLYFLGNLYPRSFLPSCNRFGDFEVHGVELVEFVQLVLGLDKGRV